MRDRDDDGAVNPGSNLFVTGIHPRLLEEEVTRLFTKYGTVEKCQIMRDPHTKESRGFGFVKMITSEEADAAKEGLQGKEFEGRTLSIEKARRARPRTPTPGKYFGPPSKSTQTPFLSYLIYGHYSHDKKRSHVAASAETDTAMIAAEEASADHAAEIATVTATVTVTTVALEDTAETEAMAEATMIVAMTEATTAATIVKTAEATVATEVVMIAGEVAETTTTGVASTATQVAAMIGTLDPAVVVLVAAAAASTEDTTAATVVVTALHVTPRLLLVATVTPRRAPMPGTPTVVRAIPMFSTVIPTPPVMDVTEFSRCPLSNVTARAMRPKRQSARSRFLAPRPLCL